MGRPRAHSDETILTAVRDLLLSEGPRAVTTAAVSARSGAPTGTLYHRFGSRDAMVAELWVRTVQRFQQHLTDVAEALPRDQWRPVRVAEAVVAFATEQPDDARLLTTASRRELIAGADLSSSLATALATLNRPSEGLARELCRDRYADTAPEHLERVTLAVYGLPATAVRQRLEHGRPLSGLRELVSGMTAAVLGLPLPGQGGP